MCATISVFKTERKCLHTHKILGKAKQGTNNNGYLFGRAMGTEQVGNAGAERTFHYTPFFEIKNVEV